LQSFIRTIFTSSVSKRCDESQGKLLRC